MAADKIPCDVPNDAFVSATVVIKHPNLAIALAFAQSELGPIARDGSAEVSTKSGAKYSYRYSTLANLLNVTRPVLNRHGLTISHRTSYTEGGRLLVTGVLEWSNGEATDFRESTLFIDASSSDPQAIGSYVTYARRYTTELLIGVSAMDDDDGAYGKGAGADANKKNGDGQQRGQQRGKQGPNNNRRQAAPPAEPPQDAPPAEPPKRDPKVVARDRIGSFDTAEQLYSWLKSTLETDLVKNSKDLTVFILREAMKTSEARRQSGKWKDDDADSVQAHIKQSLPADTDVGTNAEMAF